MKKNIIAGLTLLIAAVSACSCGKQDMTVYIGTQDLAEPEAIAEAESWFEKEMECNVEMVEFKDGLEISKAMDSSQIDFGMMGTVPTAKNIVKGMNCQVICIQSILGDVETLVVNNSINKPEDLKGKNIAVLYSSTAHYSLLKYLEVNGIDKNEVNIKNMMISDMAKAFEQGEIDGAFIWEPQLSELLKLGGKKLTSAKEIADMGYATLDLELVRTEFAKKYPDIVEKYVKCIDKAVELYNNEPDKACDALSKALHISADDAMTRIRSSQWLTAKEQSEGDWFKNGLLSKTLYDTAFFLYEEGYITEKPEQDMFDKTIKGAYINNACNK